MLGSHSTVGDELNSSGVTYESAWSDAAEDAGDGERLGAAGDGERLLLALLGAVRRGVARLFSCGRFASEVGEKGWVAVERRALRRVAIVCSRRLARKHVHKRRRFATLRSARARALSPALPTRCCE